MCASLDPLSLPPSLDAQRVRESAQRAAPGITCVLVPGFEVVAQREPERATREPRAMGCSGSKEVTETTSRPGPIETTSTSRPESEDDNKKTSTKTFDTHTTEASSYSAFRGSGPSFQSLPSTTGSNPRSEGGSDMSIFSASSKRSGGFGVGEKLSELSDEEGFEEDFEDDEEGPGRGGGARGGDRPAPLSSAGAAPAPASR